MEEITGIVVVGDDVDQRGGSNDRGGRSKIGTPVIVPDNCGVVIICDISDVRCRCPAVLA